MHLSPSHVVLPSGETGQVTHAVPHELMLLASTQMSLQGFFPAGQNPPPQAELSSMHASTHGFRPSGHCTPHFVPSHVPDPPVRVGQGTHALPQWAGSLLLTQLSPQRCELAGQESEGNPEPSVPVPASSVGEEVGASTPPPCPADFPMSGQPPGSASSPVQSTVRRFKHEAKQAIASNPRWTRLKVFMVGALRSSLGAVVEGKAPTARAALSRPNEPCLYHGRRGHPTREPPGSS
jgi:hypothetical protein